MVQKSGDHQLRLVGTLSQYLRGSLHLRWLALGFLPSTVYGRCWAGKNNIIYYMYKTLLFQIDIVVYPPPPLMIQQGYSCIINMHTEVFG